MKCLKLVGIHCLANAYFETKVSKLPPEVNIDDLYTAWENVIKRAKQFEQHKITKSELSVREHMTSHIKSPQGK